MPYDVRQWPATVYPGEAQDECPEAEAAIAVLIRTMGKEGPDPVGYEAKNLGSRLGGLWQINFKIEKLQSRVLYAPYKQKIFLFRIHRKGSPQEQKRAYVLARKRKAEYEKAAKEAENKLAKNSKGGS